MRTGKTQQLTLGAEQLAHPMPQGRPPRRAVLHHGTLLPLARVGGLETPAGGKVLVCTPVGGPWEMGIEVAGCLGCVRQELGPAGTRGHLPALLLGSRRSQSGAFCQRSH